MTKHDDTAARNERLAKALRANLARRKAQSRARSLAPSAAEQAEADRARPDAEKPQADEG